MDFTKHADVVAARRQISDFVMFATDTEQQDLVKNLRATLPAKTVRALPRGLPGRGTP